MRWQGGRQSDNVEDRRTDGDDGGIPGGMGNGGGFRFPSGGGIQSVRGGGISGILVLAAIFLFLKFCTNIDPMQILMDGGVLDQSSPGQSQTQSPASRPTAQANDQMTQFVKTVLAETEDVWTGIFQAEGKQYPPPTLVLFSGQTRSACGSASAATGPFYCPSDRKVYIDLNFYNELDKKFGASGDFAQAYVLAHEVGHHVQNLIGVLPKFNQMRQNMSEADANAMSVRVELQADCFAGIWGHFTQQKGILEAGDLEEALNAAKQIGDDTLQRKMQGYVVPESFNHGTSAQRSSWFKRGFDSGKLDSCDTFSGAI